MRIRNLRQLYNMTRIEFAKYFGVPYATVKSWELYQVSSNGRKCPDYLFELFVYKLMNEFGTVPPNADE